MGCNGTLKPAPLKSSDREAGGGSSWEEGGGRGRNDSSGVSGSGRFKPAALRVINASQGLGMEKVLRACSHPPQPLLIQGSHSSSLTQRCLKSQELPWRAPARCTTGRFPLAAGLAMDAEPAGGPCLLRSCIRPGKDSPAPPRHINSCDKTC